MRILQVAAACVLVASCVLVTACAPNVDGAPVADAKTSAATRTVAVGSELWDPCTIPDAAIDAAGLDVSTEEVGIMGRNQPGFKICSWDGLQGNDWYSFSIFSGDQDVDEIRTSPQFDRQAEVQVTGRNGIRFHATGADSSRDCQVAFAIEHGLIQGYIITNALVKGSVPEPCAEAISLFGALDSEIPR